MKVIIPFDKDLRLEFPGVAERLYRAGSEHDFPFESEADALAAGVILPASPQGKPDEVPEVAEQEAAVKPKAKSKAKKA